MWPNGTKPLLLLKSSCVCIPSWVCLGKVPFLAWHEHRKGCGHIHVTKTFPNDADSKCFFDTIFGIFGLTE